MRRTEERFLMTSLQAHAALAARAAAGDPLAQQGALALTAQDQRVLDLIAQEIESGNRELDITFGKVCLLDRDWRRIKAAEAVRDLPTLPEAEPGQPPSEELFNERWLALSKALGELSDLINRTLALEGTPSFLWDSSERRLEERQAALHSRMRVDRRGRPKKETT